MKELKNIFKDRVKLEVPMERYTSYRIGGKCRAMVFPENIQEISSVVFFCLKNRISYFTIGKGTNLLVSDKGFDGVVINLSKAFNRFEIVDRASKNFIRVFSQGGANLPVMIRRFGKEGIGSLEFACGIPGTVGGSIKGNAGSFGMSISERLEKLQVIDSEGEIREIPKNNISFEYRSCNIPDNYIIAGAWFKLQKRDKKIFDKLVAKYQLMRKKAQPSISFTAGSVFKNPPGYSAGKLIDMAGLKGKKCGEAYVSAKHSNFIISTGRAKAMDVYKLICEIKEKVWEKFRVKLELEIVLVGEGFK